MDSIPKTSGLHEDILRNQAKQSPTSGRLQDINYELVRRIGMAMAEGRIKYEQDKASWNKNYQRADATFAYNRLHNLIRHAFLLLEKYKSLMSDRPSVCPELTAEDEDHLGHMGANLNMLVWYEQHGTLPSTEPKTKGDLNAA